MNDFLEPRWDMYGSCSCVAAVASLSIVQLFYHYHLYLHLITNASSVIAIALHCSVWLVGLLLKVDLLQQRIEKHCTLVIVVKSI